MLMVSREILFDVMKHRKNITLTENESSFETLYKHAEIEFKRAKTYNEYDYMEEYSSRMLSFMQRNKNTIKYVGQGSSRLVFAMVDGTALKLAKTEAGIAQNKQEAKLCMNPMLKYEIFPDFYSADTKHWLALNCELCAPASRLDFKELFKCQPIVLINLIEKIINNKIDNDHIKDLLTNEYIKYDFVTKNVIYNILDNPGDPAIIALMSLIDFYRTHGLDELLIGDLEEIENWGITIRNNKKVLIVIDAGFNEDIYQRFYTKHM